MGNTLSLNYPAGEAGTRMDNTTDNNNNATDSETAGVDKTKTPVETPVTIISSSVVVPPSPTTQTASKSPAKQKRKKPKRDPNEPRKNLTSYVLFSNYIRPIIRERSPNISFVDLSKEMGLEFKKLSPEDRKIWDGKATL